MDYHQWFHFFKRLVQSQLGVSPVEFQVPVTIDGQSDGYKPVGDAVFIRFCFKWCIVVSEVSEKLLDVFFFVVVADANNHSSVTLLTERRMLHFFTMFQLFN